MTKSNLKTLAKALGFQNESDYFNYCVESYYNGNFTQCKELFNDMKQSDKHGLIEYLRVNVGADDVHNYFVRLF